MHTHTQEQDEQDHEIVNSYYEGEEFMQVNVCVFLCVCMSIPISPSPTHPLTHTHIYTQQNQAQEALTKMERVVELAKERGGEDLKWCFKALESIVTLHFRLGNYR